MSEELQRRKADEDLARLSQRFEDFMERYDRDIEKAEKDRGELMELIKAHDDFIKDIKPVYNRSMIAIGAFVLGSIGIGAHWVWSHVKFG